MKKLLPPILALFMVLSFVTKARAEAYTDVTPQEANDLINMSSIIVIDVSPYYANGHIPGAYNLQVGNGDLAGAIPAMDKNRAYLVYCHGDAPSITAANMLAYAGFAKVYRLKGNYGAWVAAGFPVGM